MQGGLDHGAQSPSGAEAAACPGARGGAPPVSYHAEHIALIIKGMNRWCETGSVANFGVETIWDVLTWSVGVTSAVLISVYGVSTMREAASNVRLSDRVERLFHCGDQCLSRPRFRPPQPRLDLRPARRDRIVVWRRGRQPPQSRTACRQQLFDPSDFVGRQIGLKLETLNF